ncbi:MAG: fibronectin-binding autotransporter adhesin [Thermoanaerobaculia bacterium]|jgi:uncharacterized repeat protein (TIGR01451 family)|nr:fibronectin-binding autotransporter adhesin [Thermoanaerobaculia bacterium]
MNIRNRVIARAILALAMVAVSSSAFCATVTWDAGGGDDNWSNPLNWTGDSLPTSSDDVVITTGGPGTVLLDQNATVKSINVLAGVTFHVQAGWVLTVSNPSTINTGAVLRIENSTFTGTGDLLVQGSVVLDGGTLAGSGLLYIDGGTMEVDVDTNASELSRTTTNEGFINYIDIAPGPNFIFSGATLDNNAGGSITISTDHGIDHGLASPILNNIAGGMISKNSGSGTTAINLTVNNAAGASINANTGTLALNNGGSVIGTYSIAAGCGIALTGGTFTMSGSPAFTGAGTLSIAGATLDAGANVTFPNLILSSGTITGTGAVHVSGNFTWSGGTITGSGSRVLDSTSTPIINCSLGNCLLDGAALQLQASTTYSATSNALVFSNGASLTIDAGKTLNVTTDGDFSSGGGAASSIINNGSVMKINTAGVSTIDVPLTLSGTSTVYVDAGTLQLGGGVSVVAGAFLYIDTGNTLEVTGGTFLIDSPIGITGSGIFKVSAGTLRVSTGITMSIPKVTLQGGVIDGGGTLILTGTSTWTGGTMGSATAPGGITQIDSGNTLNISGSSSPPLLTQTRQVLNNGTVSYSSFGANTLTMSASSKITNNGTLNIIVNTIIANSPAGSALIENNGIFARSAGSGGSSVYPRVENNNGATLSVISGTNLTLFGGGIAAGAYAIASGGSLGLGGAATFTVASTSSVTGAGTLLIGATVDISSGANVSWPNVDLSGGAITGAGALHVSGTFNWSGGAITGTGTRVLDSTSTTVIDSFVTLDGAALQLQASATFSGFQLQFLNGASLTIDPGKTLSITNDGDFTSGVGGGSIVNNGTIWKKTTSGTSTIGVPATLSGTSTVDLDAGTLQFGGGASVATGAALDIAGGGTLEVTGGTFLFNSGSVSMPGSSGSFRVSGGTLRVPTGITMTIPNVTLQGSGIIDGGGTLILSGTSSWTGGTMGSATAPGGVTQINSGNTLTIFGSSSPLSLNQTRNLLNNGTVNHSGSGLNTLTMSGSTKITNNGTFNLNNLGAILNSPAGSALIENNGILVRNSGGASTFQPRVENNNFATVSSTSGAFQFSGGGLAAGAYAISSGATINLLAGTFTVASTATVTGAGTLSIGGATLDAGSGVDLTCPNVALSSGTITGAGVVRVSGNFNWSGGTIAGSGPLVLNSTSTPTISCLGSCTLNGAALQLQASATSSGSGGIVFSNGASLTIDSGKTLSLTSNSGFISGVGGGSVINNGTIWKKTAAGFSFFAVPVTLSGTSTVDIDTGTLQFSGGVDVASGATVDVAVGATLEVAGGVFVFNGTGSMPGTGSFKVSAGTLRVPTGINTTVPNVTMTNGVIDGGGTLVLSGTSSWAFGTMGSATAPGGITEINPGSTLNITPNGQSLTQGRELRNSGTVNYSGTLPLTLSGASKITNNAAFHLLSDGIIFVSGSGTIDNNGTLDKSGGTGTITLGPAVNNAGTVSATAGTLSLGGGGTHTGSFTVTAPGNLSFFGTHSMAGGGSINGTGTLSFSGATATVGVPVNVGTLSITAGTATLNANASANAFTMTNGTLGGSGTLTLTNGGTWSGGTMSGSGTTINPVAKSLGISGPVTLTGRTLQNDGTLNVNGNITGSGTIANNGTLNALGIRTISAPLNNSGQLIANSVLSLSGGGTHSGTFTASGAGSVIAFSGGVHTISGPLTGTGTFGFSGGTETVNGAWTGMNINVAGGSVALNTSGTIPALNLSGGTLGGSGNVTVTGPSTWSGGTIGGSGALTFANGATVAMPGTSAATLSRPLLNNGTINYTAALSAMLIDNVPVTNNGTFDIQSSQGIMVTGGTPPFINNGTLKKSSGAGLVQFAAPLANAGLVQVGAGTLNFSGTYAQSGGTTDVLPGATLQTATLSLNGGSLTGNGTIAGNVNSDAVVAPGASPGTLTINGDYVQASNAALDIQIAGTAPGTQYDRLLVSGNVTLDGALNVSMISGFVPASGNAFQVLTFGARPGSTNFAAINGLNYGSGNLVSTFGTNDLQLIANFVQADLAVSVSAPASAANGSTFGYTVSIVNQGGSNASGASFTAALPPNVIFNSANPAICSGAPNLVCTIGALPNLSNATVVINVTANGVGAAPISVSAAGNEFDSNTANNVASASPLITAAAAAADLRIAVTGTPSTVPGSRSIYTITITNSGPDTADGVAVSVGGSAGLTFSANGGACTGSFPCNIGSLSSGQSATITSAWDISVSATGSVQLTVNAASPTADPDSSNNSASATTLIGACPAIVINAPRELRSGASATAIATTFSGAVYDWSISDGTIDSGARTDSITFTAGAPGTTTLSVNVTGSGCTLGASFPITIKPRLTCEGTATPATPVDGSTLAEAVVTFSWNEIEGASGYRLWLQQGNAAARNLGSTLGTSLTKIIPPGAQRWYVETLFDGCPSHESEHLALIVLPGQDCDTHAAPQLSAPANDTPSTSATVAFRWDAVAKAIEYELWLAPAGGVPTLIRATSDTSYTAAVPPGRLEWYVRAIFGGCDATESAHRTFTYTPPPECTSQRPLLIQPAEGERLTSPVTFEWRDVTGASSYEIYIDGELAATTTSSHSSGIPVPLGERRWRVRARLAQGCGALDSAESRFIVVETPASCTPLEAPAVTAPAQISSGVTGRIQWTFVAGATAYVVQISSDPQFPRTNTSSSVVTTRQLPFTFTNDGSVAIAHYVRVYAVDTKCVLPGQGPLSPVAMISVLPPIGSEGVALLSDPTDVPYTLSIGADLAGLSFSAVPTAPWITVTPTSGIVPPGGQTLRAVAHTAGLPPGASTGTVVITTAAAAGRAVALGVLPPLVLPIAVNNIPGVTSKAKNTPPPDALTIPAVANVKNFIVRYQSDVCVTNTSAQVIKYEINFVPTGLPGITEGQTTTASIEPGATMALNDIVTTWFGGLTSSGTLEIRPLTETGTSTSSAPAGGLADRTTFASSRTFAVTPAGGTFGQYVPAIAYTNFVTKGAVLSLQQIAQSNKTRTNLGLVEGSGEPVSLQVRIFDAAGTKRGEFPVDLNGGQHTQINEVLKAHGIALDDGRIEVEVISGAGKVTAYASVIENEVNDPLLVPPVTIDDAGHTKWVVPGVAGLTGGSGNWQTDVRVFNAGIETVDLTLTFYSRNGGTATTKTITLAGGEVRQFDRILSSFFDITQDGGALHISSATPARLVVTARTYNETGQGAYGQFISAVTPEEAVAAGSRPLQILQVEESAQYRSNVGFAEVSGNEVTLEVSVFRPGHTEPSLLEVKLAPNEFRQIDSLLSTLGLTEAYNARISVRAVSGEGRATAYLSLIDLKTGDPTYVPGQ